MPSSASWLDCSRTVAPSGYNRWLVSPAALAIHLSVGQVYAFSVFNNPLMQRLGSTLTKGSVPGHHVSGDWTKEQFVAIFSLAIVFLGLSAALFGRCSGKKVPLLYACGITLYRKERVGVRFLIQS